MQIKRSNGIRDGKKEIPKFNIGLEGKNLEKRRRDFPEKAPKDFGEAIGERRV